MKEFESRPHGCLLWLNHPVVPRVHDVLRGPPTKYDSQVGTDRAIPTSVATALSKEIKDFIEDEAPLMMLMSSPGIKKRHWDQIVKTTGITLPYEQDFVLRDLLDAGLQNFCAEIEEVRLAKSCQPLGICRQAFHGVRGVFLAQTEQRQNLLLLPVLPCIFSVFRSWAYSHDLNHQPPSPFRLA